MKGEGWRKGAWQQRISLAQLKQFCQPNYWRNRCRLEGGKKHKSFYAIYTWYFINKDKYSRQSGSLAMPIKMVSNCDDDHVNLGDY